MSEQSKPVTEAELSGDEQNNAALPAEVRDVFNRLCRLLKDAPWVGFGACLTAMGAAFLYFYFQSIDYLPADIPAILAASAAVAALALAFMVLMALSLIAPRWGFQSSGLFAFAETAESRVGLWGLDWLLVAFQLIGPGVVLLVVAFRMWIDCNPVWVFPVLPGSVFFIAGLFVWIQKERLVRCTFQHRARRLWDALWVMWLCCLPFIALTWFLISHQGVGWLDLVMLLLVWLCMLFVNALLTRKLPVWVLASVAFMLLLLLLLSVPFFLGKPSLFPIRVAELSGIRDRTPGELRIPKDTCSLIQSGLAEGQTSAALKCDTGSEWGSVKAQVLSNLGDRWFIEVPLDAGDKAGGGGSLRITIPGEGVQTVRRIVPKAEPASSCKPWRL
jgi:hypothetical protein